MRRVWGGIGVGCVLLGAALAYALLRPAERPGYTNQVLNRGGVAFVPPGETYCQRDEAIPADAREVTIFVGTDGRPAGPLELVVRDLAGGVQATGATPGTFVTGPLEIPMRPGNPSVGSGIVCLRLGGTTPVSIGGTIAEGRAGRRSGPTIPGTPGVVRDSAQLGRIRLEYKGPGRRSALAVAPVVARRASLMKSSAFGGWTIWLALLATVAAGVVAVAAAVRSASP